MRSSKMNEMLNEYIKAISDKHKPSVPPKIKSQINRFIKFCHESNIYDLSDIESYDIDNFFASKINLGHDLYSTQKYIDEVNRFFNWCINEEGLLFWNPTLDSLKPKNIKTPFRFAPPKERVQKLVGYIQSNNKAIKLRNQCIVKLGLIAGLRTFELANLTPDSYSNDTITVTGKYSLIRTIPIDNSTYKLLEQYRSNERQNITSRFKAHSEHLFLGRRGTQFKQKSIVRMFHNDLKTSLTPYDLRHFYCQELYEAGICPSLLSELIGQQSPESLSSYVQLQSIERKNKMIKQFQPFKNLS